MTKAQFGAVFFLLYQLMCLVQCMSTLMMLHCQLSGVATPAMKQQVLLADLKLYMVATIA